jgi:pantoate--beta-alanine ligase
LITEKSKIEIKIISGKTVRDKSGLALSSRNLYLSKKEIKLAVNIIKVLRKTKKELIKNFSPREIININKKVLINRGVSKIDYFELRSEKLKSRIKKGEKSRLFIAAFIGSTRLIDNLKVY